MNKQIQKLDATIKKIWVKNIADDYNNDLVLNEDTLKNVLYFYLRNYFEKSPDFKDFCIYTECTQYGFSQLNYTPDMVVIDKNSNKIVAVFELKYKASNCYKVEDLVIRDFHKLKAYMDALDTVHSECQYYIAAITLGEFDRANWLDGRSKWAKGKVAELIAYEPNGIIKFQVIPHNE
ncbi:MAG: hypothetical protein IJA52_05890 [Clostridia bacterium]|nr:hypothetical protein [Clostridia bacterium]